MLQPDTLQGLADVVRRQGEERGGDTALVYDGCATTFAEPDARTNRVARRLLALGLGPQRRIAILAKNADRFLGVLFAACKAGLVTIPVNTRLAAGEGDPAPRPFWAGRRSG